MDETPQRKYTLPINTTVSLSSERFLRLYLMLISKKTYEELSVMYNEMVDYFDTVDEKDIDQDICDLDFINRFSTIQYLFMRPSSSYGTLSDIISELSILFKEDLFDLQNEESDIKTFFIDMLNLPKSIKWKDIFSYKDTFYVCELLFTEPDSGFNTILDSMLSDLYFFVKTGHIGVVAKRLIISSSATEFTKNNESNPKGENKNV